MTLGGMQWTLSESMSSMHDNKCVHRSPTLLAPVSSMSNVPISGWLLSPSKMLMLQWSLSSCTKCAM
uniref:Uncharacterized protein n=1 Tax=Ailuropoda melanoleuca TaxID=9646 RepID=A0A7N5JYU4_AILME